MTEHQRRALIKALRAELVCTHDRHRLLLFARRWLYTHQLIIMHDRALRTLITSAVRQHEAKLFKMMGAEVSEVLLARWQHARRGL